MKETALYLPVKSLLESLGFDVYAEAINCDVIGRKQEEYNSRTQENSQLRASFSGCPATKINK